MRSGKLSIHVTCDKFGLPPKWQTRDTAGLLSVLDRAFVFCWLFPVLLQFQFSNKEFAMLVWAKRTELWRKKWRLHCKGRRNMLMHLSIFCIKDYRNGAWLFILLCPFSLWLSISISISFLSLYLNYID